MASESFVTSSGNVLDPNKPRIGILTSGGDCPGLNAVIRAVTKTGFWLGYRVIGFERGFEGLIDPIQYRVLTPENTAGILGQGGTILGSTNKGRFAARVGVDGRAELAPGIIDRVRKTFDQLQLQGLIVVGGDGSLSTALQFHEAGLPVVGVPKTIVNDLSCTAYTFGFNSAVLCCSEALDRLQMSRRWRLRRSPGPSATDSRQPAAGHGIGGHGTSHRVDCTAWRNRGRCRRHSDSGNSLDL